MTSADFDHNDKLAVERKEKLEWVTPKISLMGAVDTAGGNMRHLCSENPDTYL